MYLGNNKIEKSSAIFKVTPVEVSGSTSAAVTSLLVPQAPALLPPPAVAHIKLTSPIEAQLADDSPTNDLIGERVWLIVNSEEIWL